MEEKDIVIFGAGRIGRMAFAEYESRIRFIVDNNAELQGTFIKGIEIKKVESLLAEKDYTVMIASKQQGPMEQQLLELGITRYIFYMQDPRAYYNLGKELIFNPYENNAWRDVTEEEWNKNNRINLAMETINFQVEQMQGKENLFDHVEIETVNRCNGNCEFCPVSRENDTRDYKEMPGALFQRIIDQLAELDYSGKLALFSNNEPFLDKDIIKKHAYARKKLPHARMHLFTNGTLLNAEKFAEVIGYLDELVIDNYQQELKLIKPCQEIVEYCERHPQLKKKVTIVLRKPNEILTTRGGDAPNRKKMVSYGKVRCVLPYRQLIIRPDGKVSLCCNDPYGKNTLGDLGKDTIMDVWYNERFKMVRDCLYRGRENWKHCEFCDAFSIG